MIYHLSAPKGWSVNDFIDPDQYTLHYASVEDAIRCISRIGRGALMTKIDLKSAFRMVPVCKEDWELLGIHWQGCYYVDTCLPFGLRSAPYLFNQFATALHWILHTNYAITHLIHYLDDYLIVSEPNTTSCQLHVDTFLRTCHSLGIPVAQEKLEGPSTTLTFFGLELDSISQEVRLPPEKLKSLSDQLRHWPHIRKTSKRRLLSLIGSLSFAAKAVPAGRLFL